MSRQGKQGHKDRLSASPAAMRPGEEPFTPVGAGGGRVLVSEIVAGEDGDVTYHLKTLIANFIDYSGSTILGDDAFNEQSSPSKRSQAPALVRQDVRKSLDGINISIDDRGHLQILMPNVDYRKAAYVRMLLLSQFNNIIDCGNLKFVSEFGEIERDGDLDGFFKSVRGKRVISKHHLVFRSAAPISGGQVAAIAKAADVFQKDTNHKCLVQVQAYIDFVLQYCLRTATEKSAARSAAQSSRGSRNSYQGLTIAGLRGVLPRVDDIEGGEADGAYKIYNKAEFKRSFPGNSDPYVAAYDKNGLSIIFNEDKVDDFHPQLFRAVISQVVAGLMADVKKVINPPRDDLAMSGAASSSPLEAINVKGNVSLNLESPGLSEVRPKYSTRRRSISMAQSMSALFDPHKNRPKDLMSHDNLMAKMRSRIALTAAAIEPVNRVGEGELVLAANVSLASKAVEDVDTSHTYLHWLMGRLGGIRQRNDWSEMMYGVIFPDGLKNAMRKYDVKEANARAYFDKLERSNVYKGTLKDETITSKTCKNSDGSYKAFNMVKVERDLAEQYFLESVGNYVEDRRFLQGAAVVRTRAPEGGVVGTHVLTQPTAKASEVRNAQLAKQERAARIRGQHNRDKALKAGEMGKGKQLPQTPGGGANQQPTVGKTVLDDGLRPVVARRRKMLPKTPGVDASFGPIPGRGYTEPRGFGGRSSSKVPGMWGRDMWSSDDNEGGMSDDKLPAHHINGRRSVDPDLYGGNPLESGNGLQRDLQFDRVSNGRSSEESSAELSDDGTSVVSGSDAASYGDESEHRGHSGTNYDSLSDSVTSESEDGSVVADPAAQQQRQKELELAAEQRRRQEQQELKLAEEQRMRQELEAARRRQQDAANAAVEQQRQQEQQELKLAAEQQRQQDAAAEQRRQQDAAAEQRRQQDAAAEQRRQQELEAARRRLQEQQAFELAVEQRSQEHRRPYDRLEDVIRDAASSLFARDRHNPLVTSPPAISAINRRYGGAEHDADTQPKGDIVIGQQRALIEAALQFIDGAKIDESPPSGEKKVAKLTSARNNKASQESIIAIADVVLGVVADPRDRVNSSPDVTKQYAQQSLASLRDHFGCEDNNTLGRMLRDFARNYRAPNQEIKQYDSSYVRPSPDTKPFDASTRQYSRRPGQDR